MGVKKSINTDIKRQNRQHVLKYIFLNEVTSRPQIAYDLKMSMPTVLQNINDLEKMGLIQEVGQYESTGGRKATMIARVSEAKLAAGIDITRNHIGFVLVNLAGDILRHERIAKPYFNTQQYYIELGHLVKQFVNKESDVTEKLLGIGISIPGILNEDASCITHSHALNVQNLTSTEISSYIPWPCYFINDANAAGMAELRKMDPSSTMVYLSLSNSVGGAIFMQGNLYKGLNQRSGEFGHLQLIPDGKKCYCGQYGCLDAYCSSLVLTNQFGGRLETFFEKLSQNNEQCKKIWHDYLMKLAIAINNLRMCFDCTVVLGGYVGGWLEPWITKLRQYTDQLNPFEKGGSYIHICQYRYEASAFGAAMQPIDLFMEQI